MLNNDQYRTLYKGGKGKAGPTAPVSGLLAEMDAARRNRLRDRLHGVNLSDALDRYRNGESIDTLAHGLGYLVYRRWTHNLTRFHPDELLLPYYLALLKAIRRLRNNSVSAAGVVQYVNNVLKRVPKDYGREVSCHILPKKQTNCSRRKRGVPEYPKLTKVPRIQKRENPQEDENPFFDILEDAMQSTKPTLFDELRASSRSTCEQTIINLIEAGFTLREVCEATELTPRDVKSCLRNLRDRMASY